jgi:hypothetical protein
VGENVTSWKVNGFTNIVTLARNASIGPQLNPTGVLRAFLVCFSSLTSNWNGPQIKFPRSILAGDTLRGRYNCTLVDRLELSQFVSVIDFLQFIFSLLFGKDLSARKSCLKFFIEFSWPTLLIVRWNVEEVSRWFSNLRGRGLAIEINPSSIGRIVR